MRSAEEAGAFMRQIHAIVRYAGVCDGNMEEGSLRCDANVSLRLHGAPEFGTRTEMKNLNSFRNIERAILSEIRRQADILDEGGTIVQETRLWNADLGKSISMRSKEDAHDYRYFPDPDLLPIIIDDAWFNQIKADIPELPEAKKERYVNELGLPAADAAVLTSSIELARYFETCLSLLDKPKLVANWVMVSVLALINAKGLSIEDTPVSAAALVGLLTLVEKGEISGTMAKTVFEAMAESGKSARQIVDEKGLAQVSDSSAIEGIIDEVLAKNPAEVEAYHGGKTKLMGFFVGQVMRASKGKANPAVVNQLLEEKLKS
jgi:aspartyl-tRNA(Asn)/glutamyl-tRNA(Gln) amidotransferase subunit B